MFGYGVCFKICQIMKKFILVIIIAFFIPFTVFAEGSVYDDTYKSVDADKITENLDQNIQDFLNSNGIDPADSNWVNKLTEKNVILHIFEFITDGAKTPLKTGAGVIGIILITAAFTAFGKTSHSTVAIYASALSVAAIIAGDIWQSVNTAVNAVKGCSSFMTAFVPVFASVTALSGKTVTAASMSGLLLVATETVSFISSFLILPLMGGYLALGISTGVSPLTDNSGIAESVKKFSVWVLSLFGTLFVGVLSIQTAVNSAADGVTLRAAKFILGTSVPVGGNVISEAVAVVSSSMVLLRSSIGVYGVVVLFAIFLPILAELVIWRCVMLVCGAVSQLFSLNKTSVILKSVDSMLSVLIGVILIIGVTFIISLTVVVSAVKS